MTARDEVAKDQHLCVRCNVLFVHVMVGCPDNRPGCLIAHYSWRCLLCGGAVYGLARHEEGA